MEFQKFCREKERMCSKNTAYSCPFVNNENGDVGCDSCGYFCIHHPRIAEQIVSDWSKEHPIVTNEQKLKEVLKQTFGEDYKEIMISAEPMWANAEYKEPGGKDEDK